MRIYKTSIARSARGDIIQTQGAKVECLHLREARSLVRVSPGHDDIADADLVSSTLLKIGDLVMVDKGTPAPDIYRVMAVSPSSIGRHQYKLTRKLEDAA
ncbi:MAG: hypothetical protein OHK0011_01140 [Turneriella sp.]